MNVERERTINKNLSLVSLVTRREWRNKKEKEKEKEGGVGGGVSARK